MRNLIENHGIEILKGTVGMLSTVVGLLTSMQEEVEYLMRCTSLFVGMTVGILTGISIVRGWKKK